MTLIIPGDYRYDTVQYIISQIAKFMGPIWGPPGSCRTQVGPMLGPWTLLSGMKSVVPEGYKDRDK